MTARRSREPAVCDQDGFCDLGCRWDDDCEHGLICAWLNTGRVVRKGQKSITIVAPVMGGDGNAKVVTIKPAWVFDVTQTDERTQRAA